MVQRSYAGAVWLFVLMVSALIPACGGGSGGTGASAPGVSYYTVGGAVSGLTGAGLILQDNGGGDLAIGANGSFTFKTSVANGANYKVTVLTQPAGPTQTCTVNNGTGTISGANIANVFVVCSTNAYTVSGTVSGLTGTGLVLLDNGGSNLAITATGLFTFATPVASGANYNVTVGTQPSGPTQTCTVNGGTGPVTNANITGITVTCSTNAYAVGGTVTGLAGAGLVLLDNGGNNLAITMTGPFTFATPVASGANYNVTVGTQPSGPAQTCTVNGGTGPVTNANITGVTITCSTNAYTVGGAVSGLAGSGLVLQNNGGDNLPVTAAGNFTFATPVASGAAYNVAVKTQPAAPAQVCAVTGGSGAVVASNIASVAVNCVNVVPRYAFVTDSRDNSVSSYVVDAATGRLKYISKVAAGGGPLGVTIDPTGQYAYVMNANGGIGNGSIMQYTIGANGSLTLVSTVTGGGGPSSLAFDPTGKYAYVLNSGSVSQFTMGAGGVLTPMAPATVATGAAPTSFAIDPTGKYAYVVNSGGGTVSQYTVGAGGVLTPMTPAASVNAGAMTPMSIAIDPAGVYAYVTCIGGLNGAITQFSIGPGGGLVNVSVGAGGTGFNYITIDPTGKYAYVSDSANARIEGYTIGAGGSLIAMNLAGTGFASGPSPAYIMVDPTGKYAYAATSSGISQYWIGTGGPLFSDAPATAVAQQWPSRIAVTQGLPVQAVPQYAYAANLTGNSIAQYTIGAGGLTPMAASSVAAGTFPKSVAVDPTGRYAYAANNGSNTVSQYTVGAGGSLTPMLPASAPAGTGPASVAIEPGGRYVYVANTTTNDVSAYTIGTGGALTQVSCGAPGTAGCTGAAVPTNFAAGTGPTAIAADPSGQYIYVVNNMSSDVSAYTIGVGGVLTQISCGFGGTAGCIGAAPPTNFATAANPNAITADPSGRYVYVTSGTNNGISQFSIGAGGGLTPGALAPLGTLGTLVAAGTMPDSVTVAPSGLYAYVANQNTNDVSQYTIAGGQLTAMGTARVAAGSAPRSVNVDPSGKYAYVANYMGNNISQYTIGAGGALAPLGAAAPAGMGPWALTTTGTWQ